ncbi:MAG TPA: proton-conducting transporter membrane subunit [Planctomycetaceae bacterium]|nr:proton-conducting transporter membrane subunit [Planctomycetaceae bacterium]
MILWLVIAPVLLGGLAFALPANRLRPWMLPVTGIVHTVLSVWCVGRDNPSQLDGWVALDPLGKLFLLLVSVVFLICALYAPSYLLVRENRDNRTLCASMCLSLGMMSLIVISHHLGLMWVAMEASTLLTATSLFFNHNPRSLEASWKYLLLCSVGIALALLGSFFLAYSMLYAGLEPTLLLEPIVEQAPRLSHPWLHAAFVLLFVGYGTKMGLAPMHTWKPDAYGEAPGMIGALLAGGLTNCAFLAILRFYHIAEAASDVGFARRMMLVVGLLSMGLAAVSMVRQRDLKRLLAYSSIEHMGILVFGFGIGGAAVLGSLMHVVHNGLTKGVLFLAAANIHRAYGSKFTHELRGVLERLPFSGWMLFAGFLAITGSPPFAPFVSEFQIVRASFQQERFWEGGLFLLFMLLVFVGMGVSLVAISFGRAPEGNGESTFSDSPGTGFPILLAMALVLLLGVYNPPEFLALLEGAVRYLEPATRTASL